MGRATFPEIIQFGAVLVQIAWKLWTMWTGWTKSHLKIGNNGHNRLYTTVWTCMFFNVWLKVRILPGPPYAGVFPQTKSPIRRYRGLSLLIWCKYVAVIGFYKCQKLILEGCARFFLARNQVPINIQSNAGFGMTPHIKMINIDFPKVSS